MKHQITKATFRPVGFGSVLAALLLGIAVSSPAQFASSWALPCGFGQPAGPAQVLPPQPYPYGHSYAEWSAKWWQWNLEQSTNNLELVGGPGLGDFPACGVRFLAGSLLTGGATSVTNQVTIPDGSPLFLTVLSVWDDNSGCPFTSYTADQLAATVAGEWTLVTSTTCTIDGVPVPGLSDPATTDYLVAAPPFGYMTAENGNVLAGIFGDTCIDGGTVIYPAVADGVYLMLAPLSPGKHLIHTVGVVGPISAPYVVEDVTYDITVQRDGGGCGGGK